MIKDIKVTQLHTYAGYNAYGQYIIKAGDLEIFQSYDSIIAKKYKGQIYLDKIHWNYSNTTARYRNRYLGEDIKETRRKIINGTYKLANLNKR